MTTANVTFSGAKNSVDSTFDNQRELLLKVFAGEVITQFEESSLVLDKHTVRTITNGKSA